MKIGSLFCITGLPIKGKKINIGIYFLVGCLSWLEAKQDKVPSCANLHRPDEWWRTATFDTRLIYLYTLEKHRRHSGCDFTIPIKWEPTTRIFFTIEEENIKLPFCSLNSYAISPVIAIILYCFHLKLFDYCRVVYSPHVCPQTRHAFAFFLPGCGLAVKRALAVKFLDKHHSSSQRPKHPARSFPGLR